MKITFKYIIGLSLTLLILFIVYIYNLHSLAVEGNKIFEYRCTNVNPPLIAYKNSFLKYADYLNTYPNNSYTPEQLKEIIDGYINGMRAYIPEETKWLEIQEKYLDRWDFKLFEPWYIKDAGHYQYEMYRAYRDDAKSLLAIFENPELGKNVKPGQLSDERERRDTYSEKYSQLFDKYSKIKDWRKYFTNVPVPEKCNEQNLTIPDTSGSIDWDGKMKNTPTGVPINNPDLTS